LGGARAICAVKDAHDSGLRGGIRGGLRHLSLGVEDRAIDGEPNGAKQKDAHRQRQKNDRLAIFILKSRNEAFNLHDEAPQ
jgi:hypothetical protein